MRTFESHLEAYVAGFRRAAALVRARALDSAPNERTILLDMYATLEKTIDDELTRDDEKKKYDGAVRESGVKAR